MNQKRFEDNPKRFLEELGYVNVQKDSIHILPKYTLFEMEGGKRRRLASDKELQKANEFVLSEKSTLLLYHALHRNDEDNKAHCEYLEQHHLEFKDLFYDIIEKSEKLIKKPKAVERLQRLMELNFNKVNIDKLSEEMLKLLTFTRAEASSDFSFFNEKISKDMYRFKEISECLSATIIYQSVTGFYETRIDLNIEK